MAVIGADVQREHRAEKRIRFSALDDALIQGESIGSIPKVQAQTCKSTSGADALAP
jgi:hypothetical protein